MYISTCRSLPNLRVGYRPSRDVDLPNRWSSETLFERSGAWACGMSAGSLRKMQEIEQRKRPVVTLRQCEVGKCTRICWIALLRPPPTAPESRGSSFVVDTERRPIDKLSLFQKTTALSQLTVEGAAV